MTLLTMPLSRGCAKCLDMATAPNESDHCEEQKAKDPVIDKEEHWKVEYNELSEDFRHLRTVGWQAPFAVLALDGIMLLPAFSLLANHTLLSDFGASMLILVSGLFTVFIGIDVFKWIERGDVRRKRLAKYDCQIGFGRYFPDEAWWLKLPMAKGMAWLVVVVGFGLIIFSIALLGNSIASFA